MELSGHPTQDLIDELISRGAVPVAGDRTGPEPEAFGALPDEDGGWLFIPVAAFQTGVDESPV